jgi:hypothetical protein
VSEFSLRLSFWRIFSFFSRYFQPKVLGMFTFICSFFSLTSFPLGVFGFLDPSCIRFWTSPLRRFQQVTPHSFSFIIAIFWNSSPLDILYAVAGTAFLVQTCRWEGLKMSGAIVFLLTFRRRNFLLNFSTPVFKMWIIQEPKKVALWNKRHFEE